MAAASEFLIPLVAGFTMGGQSVSTSRSNEEIAVSCRRFRQALAVALLAGITFSLTSPSARAADDPPPSFVIIFCDDLGYGDLGCYGHPTIRTPRVDQMAAEGVRFTQFYCAAPVCTPSRAALMTGRYPLRSGMHGEKRRVLFPDSERGLPAEEITLAEALRTKGYATACVGKWHLGHHPQYLPTNNGFDRYFGIPYSNDMRPRTPAARARGYPPLPLLRDEATIETSPDQGLLTERYTEEAIRFIRDCTRPGEQRPFFLYLPHTMPHVPLYASERFAGISARGLFGDVVETIDWSTGQILDTLRDAGVADRTIVFLTSDNGPWLIQGDNGGSAGLLRGGKGSTWEGGMREPCIAWCPGRVREGVVTNELGTTMDLYATCLALAGVPLPTDRTVDGVDLSPVLFGEGKGPRSDFFYYRGPTLMAVRQGPWKLHYMTQSGYGQPKPEQHDPPLLFNLEHDPSEQRNVAKDHPEIIAQINHAVEQHRAAMTPGEPQY